jgi:hypothetical protein
MFADEGLSCIRPTEAGLAARGGRSVLRHSHELPGHEQPGKCDAYSSVPCHGEASLQQEGLGRAIFRFNAVIASSGLPKS